MTRCSCIKCDCNVLHKENIDKIKEENIDDEVIFSVSKFFKVLSDKTRLKIVSFLLNSRLCVCDLSSLLNQTKSCTSHQLKNLKDMGLVDAKREGKEIWYSLKDDHVKEVFNISLQHVLEGKNE